MTWRSMFGTIIDHSIVSKGGVCTHYNRDIMAHQCVHTTGTAATQNVRCLVSINIGSTGWLLQAISCISAAFFFIGPYVSCVDRVPWRDAHLSARNLPLSRFDAGSQNMRAIFPPSNVAFNATDRNYAVLFIDKDEHSVSLSCRFQRNSISRLRMFVHLEEILRCKITRNTRNT